MSADSAGRPAAQPKINRGNAKHAPTAKQTLVAKPKTSGVRTVPGHLSKPVAVDKAKAIGSNSAKAKVLAKADGRPRVQRTVQPPPPKAKGEALATRVREEARAKGRNSNEFQKLDYRASSISLSPNGCEDELDGASYFFKLDSLPGQRTSMSGVYSLEDRSRLQDDDILHQAVCTTDKTSDQMDPMPPRRGSFLSDDEGGSLGSTSSLSQPEPERVQNRRRSSFLSDDESDSSMSVAPTLSLPMAPSLSIVITPPPEETGRKQSEAAILRFLREKDDIGSKGTIVPEPLDDKNAICEVATATQKGAAALLRGLRSGEVSKIVDKMEEASSDEEEKRLSADFKESNISIIASENGYIHETLLLAQLAEIKNHQINIQKLLQMEKQRHLSEVACWEKQALELSGSLAKEPELARAATEAREERFSSHLESCEKKWQCEVSALRAELAALQHQQKNRIDAISHEEVSEYLRAVYRRAIVKSLRKSVFRYKITPSNGNESWEDRNIAQIGANNAPATIGVFPRAQAYALAQNRAHGCLSPSVSTRSCSPERSLATFAGTSVSSPVLAVRRADVVAYINTDIQKSKPPIIIIPPDMCSTPSSPRTTPQTPLFVSMSPSITRLSSPRSHAAVTRSQSVPLEQPTSKCLSSPRLQISPLQARARSVSPNSPGPPRRMQPTQIARPVLPSQTSLPSALPSKAALSPSKALTPVSVVWGSPSATKLQSGAPFPDPVSKLSLAELHRPSLTPVPVVSAPPSSTKLRNGAPELQPLSLTPVQFVSAPPSATKLQNSAPLPDPVSKPSLAELPPPSPVRSVRSNSPGPPRQRHPTQIARAMVPSQTSLPSAMPSKSQTQVPVVSSPQSATKFQNGAPLPDPASKPSVAELQPLQSPELRQQPYVLSTSCTTCFQVANEVVPANMTTPSFSSLSLGALGARSSTTPTTSPRSGVTVKMPSVPAFQSLLPSQTSLHSAFPSKALTQVPVVSSPPSVTRLQYSTPLPNSAAKPSLAESQLPQSVESRWQPSILLASCPAGRQVANEAVPANHANPNAYASFLGSTPQIATSVQARSSTSPTTSPRSRVPAFQSCVPSVPLICFLRDTMTSPPCFEPPIFPIFPSTNTQPASPRAPPSGSTPGRFPAVDQIADGSDEARSFILKSVSGPPTPREFLSNAFSSALSSVVAHDTTPGRLSPYGSYASIVKNAFAAPIVPLPLEECEKCPGASNPHQPYAVPNNSLSVPLVPVVWPEVAGEPNPLRRASTITENLFSAPTWPNVAEEADPSRRANDVQNPSIENALFVPVGPNIGTEVDRSSRVGNSLNPILESTSLPQNPLTEIVNNAVSGPEFNVVGARGTPACARRCISVQQLLGDALDASGYDALVDAAIVCQASVVDLDPHAMRSLGSAEERLRRCLDHELCLTIGHLATSLQDLWPRLRRLLLYCLRLGMTDLQSFKRAREQAGKLQRDPLSFCDPSLMRQFQQVFDTMRLTNIVEARCRRMVVERVIELEPGQPHAAYLLRRGYLARYCDNYSTTRVVSQNMSWAAPLGLNQEPLNSKCNECYLFYSAAVERIGENAADVFNDFNSFGNHVYLAEYASHACHLAAGTGRRCCAFSMGRRAIVVCRAFCGRIRDAGRCSPTDSLLGEMREPRSSVLFTESMNSEYKPYDSIMCTSSSSSCGDREFVLPIDQVLPEFVVFCRDDYSAERPYLSPSPSVYLSARDSQSSRPRTPKSSLVIDSRPPPPPPVVQGRSDAVRTTSRTESQSSRPRTPRSSLTIDSRPPSPPPVSQDRSAVVATPRTESQSSRPKTPRSSHVSDSRPPSPPPVAKDRSDAVATPRRRSFGTDPGPYTQRVELTSQLLRQSTH